ncbi:CLUMA_CG017410, isoform A [Clunio marinus]|uniref:CLUMA_CG017410, isoform A n=1 Tax=Clunio marinus TaxID=568069 RepID=A0A1J1IX83_9DIPT|nr:CLUMA_CG017410, isoform A [Clunio marinus]
MAGHIFLLCSNGQKLEDNSMKVAEGVYASRWETFQSIKVKKHILFIMMKSQRAKRLTALNFADVSLSSFAHILATTWSYFNLLKRVSNGT